MTDMRSPSYRTQFLGESPDVGKCIALADELVRYAGGIDSFLQRSGEVLRLSVDEVIDMTRTQRYSIDHLEKTEKTYIGTKVEILFRHEFQLPRGKKLDLLINSVELDVKNTIGSSWMIPQEAVDEHCLLIKINDKKGIFSIGVVYCSLDNLTVGMNRDQKRSISPGSNAIFWIGKNVRMQKNFFESLAPDTCLQLTDQKASGAERVRRLFRLIPNEVIGRYIIECVAQQKDPMRRVRSNGGARDKLAKEGIEILSGTYDSELLKSYGFFEVGPEDWVAVHPKLLT